MKLVRTLSMIIALAGASTVYADTPPAKAPAADKKAPEKAPAKADEMSAADAAKAEKFMMDFIDALVKNQDACPKMAAAINSLLSANEAWLVKMAESAKEPPAALKDKLQKRQNEMIGAVMKCKDDKDVGAAMQRFTAISMKKKAAAAEKNGSAPPAKKN